MKYRKKPIVIEAFKWLGSKTKYPNWIIRAIESEDIWFNKGSGVTNIGMRIRTLEGIMEAAIGDYIIQGIKGEIYPCKPDIFEATYEKVE